MTTAEMLRAEGEARGRAATLVELLTFKFGALPPAVTAAVFAASAEQLRIWATRVLSAGSLDDVLHVD